MPVPKLDDSQIAWIFREVARYIETQRQSYRPGAVPLDRSERAAMQPFFPASCLDSARVAVLSDHRVAPAPSENAVLGSRLPHDENKTSGPIR